MPTGYPKWSGRTMIKVESLTIAELSLALRGRDDRRVIV